MGEAGDEEGSGLLQPHALSSPRSRPPAARTTRRVAITGLVALVLVVLLYEGAELLAPSYGDTAGAVLARMVVGQGPIVVPPPNHKVANLTAMVSRQGCTRILLEIAVMR
jgi:hypothetical protein